MAIDLNSEEGLAIRKLIPLATLPGTHFEALCTKLTVETAEPGSLLFRRGDVAQEFIYLLNGKVTLQAQGLKVETLKAESNAARFALAHQQPRKIDAIAEGVVRYLRVEIELINDLEPVFFEEESSYMVIDDTDESSDDWMTTLLKSPIFQRLPAANLQKILMELEDAAYNKGDVIVKQGEPGDYYYLIKSGQCILTRKPSPNAREIKLAQLRANDTFGEDSLLSGKPRNVTVTALTKMLLLRIDREKFITLIKEPALNFIRFEELQNMPENETAVIDVRPPDLFNKGHLKNSSNTPFFSLRMQLKTLNRKKNTIVVCDDGKTSEAAAFLLIRHKFNALILAGGLNSVPPEAINKKASFSIVDGVETVISQSDLLPAEPLASSRDEDVQPSESTLDQQLEILSAENKSLRDTLQQLKGKYMQLNQQHKDTEKRYRMLYKQAEKLKELLKKRQENQ